FALNMPRGGVVVASGALNVAYSDGSDPYAQRAKRMLSSSVLCSLAVLLGALSGSHNAAAVIIATLWAFAAGMFVAVGTTAADLGVISLVTLLIYAAQPHAAVSGLDRARSMAAVRYRALLRQVERMRLSLLMLSRLHVSMQRESPMHSSVQILGDYVKKAAQALQAIGDSLTSGIPAEA